jgi:aspartyl-tRNA(Asn)/glutamyl-tRNA(Gln) amidotransferase subunit A
MDAGDLTAEQLVAAFRRGTLTPVEALEAVTGRIASCNPEINAFAVLDSGAGDAARQSALRWRAGRPLGPLDGVPCTVKDLVDMVGLPTRRGSLTTDEAGVSEDAPLVLGLKAAGAVIVGKTTTTEFGWKTPGECPLHGITRNPRHPGRTTGGSSSGAAAAAAAGFGALHVGTDAGGSIRIPAAWCGVVGLKPTFGRVPQWPLGAFANIAVAGPIARTVRDAALMLNALARWDPRDPYCWPEPGRDWRDGIEDGVGGMRIGILRRPGFAALASAGGWAAVEQAARIFAAHGAEVEEVAPDLPDAADLFASLWSTALRLVVANTPPERRALLDPGLREVAARKEMAATALLQGLALQNQAANVMARLHLGYELVICPVVPGPPTPIDAPLTDPVRALIEEWAPWTFLFNMTRQPAISVPMGVDAEGLPRSVQIAAAISRDDLVLRAARVLEAASAPCG